MLCCVTSPAVQCSYTNRDTMATIYNDQSTVFVVKGFLNLLKLIHEMDHGRTIATRWLGLCIVFSTRQCDVKSFIVVHVPKQICQFGGECREIIVDPVKVPADRDDADTTVVFGASGPLEGCREHGEETDGIELCRNAA